MAQRPPDLAPALHGQAGEQLEGVSRRVDARPAADLPKAEDMIWMAIDEAPPRGIEHQVDALFLFVFGHAKAVRQQPQIAQRLFQNGEIESLLQMRVDHHLTVQSATT